MPEASGTYYPPPPKGLPFALAPALFFLLGLSAPVSIYSMDCSIDPFSHSLVLSFT